MRFAVRILLTRLSVPALAFLTGVGHARFLVAPEAEGHQLDRPAIRQPAKGLLASSPIALSAFRHAGLAAPNLVIGGRLLHMTAPSYPVAAKQASVSGVVTVEAVIGVDGRVLRTSVLRGPVSLRRVAQDTVRNWRYEPTLLNGKPVERVAEVDLNFVLGRY
jgi:TonB family protein